MRYTTFRWNPFGQEYRCVRLALEDVTVNSLLTIQLVTKEKAAEQLSLEIPDIDHLIDTGQLPVIRIHGKQLFDLRDIAKLVNTYKRIQQRSNDNEGS